VTVSATTEKIVYAVTQDGRCIAGMIMGGGRRQVGDMDPERKQVITSLREKSG